MDNKSITYRVIKDGKVRGICGSGLIDLIAELVKLGLIDKSGKLIDREECDPNLSKEIKNRIINGQKGNNFLIVEGKETENGNPVYLTQRDIREVQLAKAAILAGIKILLKEVNIPQENIQKVLLAGAFGNFIDKKSAIRIGLIPYLPLEKIIEIFKRLKDDEKIAELLAELGSELQTTIMEALGKEKASDILEEMDTDEAADFLGEITPEESRELLDLMPKEEAEEIKELLKYKENTAGSIMNNEFGVLPEDLTAEEAIKKIRELSPEAEMIYYVYIVDKREKLIGVISLRDLIMANPKAKISEFMEEDVVTRFWTQRTRKQQPE